MLNYQLSKKKLKLIRNSEFDYLITILAQIKEETKQNKKAIYIKILTMKNLMYLHHQHPCNERKSSTTVNEN